MAIWKRENAPPTPEPEPEGQFFRISDQEITPGILGMVFQSRNPRIIEQLLAEEAPEGEAAEGEAAEGEEGAEGLPEGYPVDEEGAAEGMKVEVRTITFILKIPHPTTGSLLTLSLTPEEIFLRSIVIFLQKEKI